MRHMNEHTDHSKFFILSIFIMVLTLFWRSSAVNLSEINRFYSAETALNWHEFNPEALAFYYQKKRPSLNNENYTYLRDWSYRVPSDSRTWAYLASWYANNSDLSKSSKIAEIADHLAPMWADTQLRLGDLAFRDHRIKAAVQHWDKALRVDPQLSWRIYPALFKFISNDELRPVVLSSLKLSEKPNWWYNFFSKATERYQSLTLLDELYQHSQQYTDHEKEQLLYIRRLQQLGLWSKARTLWLNTQRDLLKTNTDPLIVDGGFEHKFTTQPQPFGWLVRQPYAGITISQQAVLGAEGKLALNVHFANSTTPFKGAQQTLLLAPGFYHLKGMIKTDLQAAKGVRWVVKCQNNNQLLAATDPITGRQAWREFTVRLTIPDTCPIQMLYLELYGRFKQEWRADGDIWTDALQIQSASVQQ